MIMHGIELDTKDTVVNNTQTPSLVEFTIFIGKTDIKQCSSAGKESACNAGDLCSIPG